MSESTHGRRWNQDQGIGFREMLVGIEDSLKDRMKLILDSSWKMCQGRGFTLDCSKLGRWNQANSSQSPTCFRSWVSGKHCIRVPMVRRSWVEGSLGTRRWNRGPTQIDWLPSWIRGWNLQVANCDSVNWNELKWARKEQGERGWQNDWRGWNLNSLARGWKSQGRLGACDLCSGAALI